MYKWAYRWVVGLDLCCDILSQLAPPLRQSPWPGPLAAEATELEKHLRSHLCQWVSVPLPVSFYSVASFLPCLAPWSWHVIVSASFSALGMSLNAASPCHPNPRLGSHLFGRRGGLDKGETEGPWGGNMCSCFPALGWAQWPRQVC